MVRVKFLGNIVFFSYFVRKWESIITAHEVPEAFFKIKKFFLRPDFSQNPTTQRNNISDEDIEVLDFLLWKWKGKLSREWYPCLFGLKQDLQINKNLLTSERIVKTQTIPLSKFLNEGEFK